MTSRARVRLECSSYKRSIIFNGMHTSGRLTHASREASPCVILAIWHHPLPSRGRHHIGANSILARDDSLRIWTHRVGLYRHICMHIQLEEFVPAATCLDRCMKVQQPAGSIEVDLTGLRQPSDNLSYLRKGLCALPSLAG